MRTEEWFIWYKAWYAKQWNKLAITPYRKRELAETKLLAMTIAGELLPKFSYRIGKAHEDNYRH